MAITFRVGRHIDPSGFGMAVVDIPEISPEKNVSLIDYSHRWEENVSSTDKGVIQNYVDSGGHMPLMTITDFLVTNITTTSTNDVKETPLWYRHRCRFFHFTYGETPGRQVFITDQYDNIIKDINYKVRAERVGSNVYLIDVLTDFQNNDYTIYKVKYNRCKSDATEVYPGWVEVLNAEPLYEEGAPFTHPYEYSVWGPNEYGLYSAVVPPVPTLSALTNSIGISFEQSPTLIEQDCTSLVEYDNGVTVRYTLKATGTTTFTVRRNVTPTGSVTSDVYLQSATVSSWGVAPVNFTIGTKISSIGGFNLWVHGDNYLKNGDEAFFSASKTYFYLMKTSYSTIYLKKPEHVIPTDDWFIQVHDGKFRRRMNSVGAVVPSGYPGAILFEYDIPEYDYQMWHLEYGPPYKESIDERAEILDRQTIQLQRTPLFVDPSSVIYDPDAPGFPPTGYLRVYVNESLVPSTGVLDWDVYNGTVKLAQLLSHRDDIIVTYAYKEENYEYTGFFGSGGLYPTVPVWEGLDVNPTPSHGYGLYASGTIAHMFLRPYAIIDDGPGGYGQPTVICSEALYHNYTGTASGVYDFKLGTISLGHHCRPEDLVITDVRTRGGGLSKKGVEDVELVKDVQPESEFFWDVGYFDGQAVPANGVLVVRIPKRVLVANGGQFQEDEVRQKVLKHMALGSYPIIEYV